jgi:hypothetical protein
MTPGTTPTTPWSAQLPEAAAVRVRTCVRTRVWGLDGGESSRAESVDLFPTKAPHPPERGVG